MHRNYYFSKTKSKALPEMNNILQKNAGNRTVNTNSSNAEEAVTPGTSGRSKSHSNIFVLFHFIYLPEFIKRADWLKK